jgi:hypothetical protein
MEGSEDATFYTETADRRRLSIDAMHLQTVLWPFLHKALAGVDHKNALAGVGIFLFDDDAGGDAGAVKEVGRQADNAFDIALADERAADVGLGMTTEKNAMRKDACAYAIAAQ